MTQSDFDKSVRVLFYQIVLMPSKVSGPADVTGEIQAFYESYNLTNPAIAQIDSILHSVGIDKEVRQDTEFYIFNKITNHFNVEDSSKILNEAINLIKRILKREELQYMITYGICLNSESDVLYEIDFLNKEINSHIS